MSKHNRKIAIIGLGTVGLTLGTALAKHSEILGFDTDETRVDELKKGFDHNGAFSEDQLSIPTFYYTSDPKDLAEPDFYIVAVPTPINFSNEPDLNSLVGASKIIGEYLKLHDIVVYESTDYPGTTENVCIPELEKESGLKSNKDFSVGYSPERINPGDKTHKMEDIVKLIAAQNEPALYIIGEVYKSIIKAGVHPVSSIKVAEASKVVENIQRDVNIALVNEVALIMHKMGIDTKEVLDAAATKWCFHCYAPGLVGGDCIGVDPYYLIFRSAQLGYVPEVISASRRVNSMMGKFVAEETIKEMAKLDIRVLGANVAILGLAFKENYPEEKNTRVIDIINELKKYKVEITISDPLVNPDLVEKNHDFKLTPIENIHDMDALIVAVAHDEYKAFTENDLLNMLRSRKGLVMDVKGIFSKKKLKQDKITLWAL